MPTPIQGDAPDLNLPSLEEMYEKSLAQSHMTPTPWWNDWVLVILAIAVIVMAVMVGRVIWRERASNSKITEGFRRLALALATLSGIVGMFFGFAISNHLSLAARIEHRPEVTDHRLLYAALGAVISFSLVYGLLRLLGWIVDGFISGAKGRA